LERLEDEITAIREALEPLIRNNKVVIKQLPNARWNQFEEAVREGYDLVHFTGHGGIWQGFPVLYFHDEEGEPEPIPQHDLVSLFRNASAGRERHPKLGVLNACRTAQQDVIEGTLGLAEALVQEGQLPAAIGMGYVISEEAARIFSKTFYQTLVTHGQVDHAVMAGRSALSGQIGSGLRDWGIPRLYLQVREGVIFDWIK
jgi:CHAT domain-containing protein